MEKPWNGVSQERRDGGTSNHWNVVTIIQRNPGTTERGYLIMIAKNPDSPNLVSHPAGRDGE